ncbi:MAG: hypothetical protein ACPGO5_03505 [Patescibacteria group bacterium]
MKTILRTIVKHLYAGWPFLYPGMAIVLIASFYAGNMVFFAIELIICAASIAIVYIFPEEMSP